MRRINETNWLDNMPVLIKTQPDHHGLPAFFINVQILAAAAAMVVVSIPLLCGSGTELQIF